MNRLAWLSRHLRLSALVLLISLFALPLLRGTAHALPAYWSGSDAAFYALPNPIPALPAGQIYRWQRFAPSDVLTAGSDGVMAYRIMYASRDAYGQPSLVTGVVMVPVRVYAPNRPIMGFAVGSQGMHDSCASSHGIDNSTNYDLIYMRQALDRGFTVAASDYQGLGTTTSVELSPGIKEHTQVVGKILGQNVLDSVRAARQLNGQFNNDRAAYFPWKVLISGNMSSSSKVVLWGYSEGGAAAGWAAQLQPSYAPELLLVGMAAGGVPADVLRVGRAINKPTNIQNVSFGALIAASIGYAEAYSELHDELDEYHLKPTGLAVVESVKQQCLFEQILSNFGGHQIQEYTIDHTNPLDDPRWQLRFEENRLGKVKTPVPVFLYHGLVDEAVEYAQARDYARNLCHLGVRVNWNPYVGDHVTTYLQGMGAALDFLNNRVNGWFTNAIVCEAIF